MTKNTSLIGGALLATFLSAPLFAQDISPKGVFREPSNTGVKNGVSYRVVLSRNGEQHEVPVTSPFRSMDKFRLQVKLKDDAYVYVINRTLDGDPEVMGSKGINIIRDEDSRRPRTAPAKPVYTLLYPLAGERGQKIKKGQYRDIPGNDLLGMDRNPGVEKLYVVISDQQLDLASMFKDGQIVNGSTGGRDSADRPPARRADSPDDAVGRLDKSLAEWADNSQSEMPAADEKGVVREGGDRDGYTVGNRSKPIVAEITLKHFR